MSENINCYEKVLEKPKKPLHTSQEDTRANNGQHQTVAEWLKNGGKKPSINC
jgi:hypothetical protein